MVLSKYLQVKKFSNLTNEITMIRREIINDLTKFSSITSLSNTKIDLNLVNIRYILKENPETYKLQFITSGQYEVKIQNPLFVTAQHPIEHEKVD